MDRYILSAESLLGRRAFSVPDGAALEVTGVNADNFDAVKAKVLHILGDAPCTVGEVTRPLSETESAEGTLLLQAEDFLDKKAGSRCVPARRCTARG